jgi:cell division protein FtsZ
VLINITGGKDITLLEVSKASELIHSLAHPDANIIFGTVIDESMKELVKVTVIATGFDQTQEETIMPGDFAQPRPKTPPPFEVPQQTPPYIFEPKGSETLWQRPAWEKQWEPFETPSFIRRNKQTSVKKHPYESS